MSIKLSTTSSNYSRKDTYSVSFIKLIFILSCSLIGWFSILFFFSFFASKWSENAKKISHFPISWYTGGEESLRNRPDPPTPTEDERQFYGLRPQSCGFWTFLSLQKNPDAGYYGERTMIVTYVVYVDKKIILNVIFYLFFKVKIREYIEGPEDTSYLIIVAWAAVPRTISVCMGCCTGKSPHILSTPPRPDHGKV